MKQSQLFSKTRHDRPKEGVAINQDLLVRAGFVDQVMAGVYSYLPLGYLTLQKIADLVRQEMLAIDGQEVLLPALQPKSNWEQTHRWNEFDVLFKVKSQTKTEYALGPTHEEIIAPLMRQFISSYRDLPRAVFQIQVKFRDELRAKSGLLRGREFLMKDLYSFHADSKDLDLYYDRALNAYKRIFQRLECNAILTEASGGSFSKYSHEFQVPTPNGEDLIYRCACGFAQNKEIAKVGQGDPCPACERPIEETQAIEVGNIFKLQTKYTEPFNVVFTDQKGKLQPVLMGCYGIGISRLLGAIAEVHHDDRGLIWPAVVAPFQAHLIDLLPKQSKRIQKLYDTLLEQGFKILWDDRDLSAGEKFHDADLIGLPVRLVISNKTGEDIEVKDRKDDQPQTMGFEKLIGLLKKKFL